MACEKFGLVADNLYVIANDAERSESLSASAKYSGQAAAVYRYIKASDSSSNSVGTFNAKVTLSTEFDKKVTPIIRFELRDIVFNDGFIGVDAKDLELDILVGDRKITNDEVISNKANFNETGKAPVFFAKDLDFENPDDVQYTLLGFFHGGRDNNLPKDVFGSFNYSDVSVTDVDIKYWGVYQAAK